MAKMEFSKEAVNPKLVSVLSNGRLNRCTCGNAELVFAGKYHCCHPLVCPKCLCSMIMCGNIDVMELGLFDEWDILPESLKINLAVARFMSKN